MGMITARTRFMYQKLTRFLLAIQSKCSRKTIIIKQLIKNLKKDLTQLGSTLVQASDNL